MTMLRYQYQYRSVTQAPAHPHTSRKCRGIPTCHALATNTSPGYTVPPTPLASCQASLAVPPTHSQAACRPAPHIAHSSTSYHATAPPRMAHSPPRCTIPPQTPRRSHHATMLPHTPCKPHHPTCHGMTLQPTDMVIHHSIVIISLYIRVVTIHMCFITSFKAAGPRNTR